MAERKKKRGKNEPTSTKVEKEDETIAKFVRFNCPTNSTMFEGNEVHYFSGKINLIFIKISGKKAVDLLVESKKYGANAKDPKFATTSQAEFFMQSLLERGLFFRAKKVVLKKKDKTLNEADDRKDKAINKEKDTPNNRKKAKKPEEDDEHKTKSKQNNDTNDVEDTDSNVKNEDNSQNNAVESTQEEEKKKKKKIKLIAHEHQCFVVDTSGDVYVWIFDPTPFYKKLIGLLMVLGTIAGCLFPLWPDWLRLGIYYLSVTGIGLFGALLGVALGNAFVLKTKVFLARTLLFGIIWLCTLGRHRLWVLPNLTEDCGFFESFKPFYTYEYIPDAKLKIN